jgi:thiosulfate/3-mercaptopyruvate sulfurtransferase
MDGGRAKWTAEGRVLTTDVPSFVSTDYEADEPDASIRALREEVFQHMADGGQLVDVRSPQEYIGEVTHMAGYPQEGALRGGHIPGANNVPWSRAAAEDGTFKSRDALEAIYLEEQGLTSGDKTIAYCRIGERSSHTWFVLRYLLGFQGVKNYDGSWTEWGNLVGAPIEKGEPDDE